MLLLTMPNRLSNVSVIQADKNKLLKPRNRGIFVAEIFWNLVAYFS